MFAQYIQNARFCLEMTQTEFAEMLGYSQNAVSKWESGDSVPKNQKLIRHTVDNKLSQEATNVDEDLLQ